MSNQLNSLTEAKKIYTNQLCKLLQNQIYKGFVSIWEKCSNDIEPFKSFQNKLDHVEKWNSLIINDEYERILKETKCNYFDKLLDAVFIVNAKILSVLNNKNSMININVPTPKNFLHYCYITCAYSFYFDPFLFNDKEQDYRKKQQNIKSIMDNIHKCIEEAIENLLPIEQLLLSSIDDSKEELEQKMYNQFVNMKIEEDNNDNNDNNYDNYENISKPLIPEEKNTNIIIPTFLDETEKNEINEIDISNEQNELNEINNHPSLDVAEGETLDNYFYVKN